MAPTFQFLLDGARGFVEALQSLGPVLPYTIGALGGLYVALVAMRTAMQMEALIKGSAAATTLLGNASFKAGLKIAFGFAPFILAGAAIYAVYKLLGPTAAILTAAGIAGYFMGAGMLAALWPVLAIIAAVGLLMAALYGIYKLIKMMANPAKALFGALDSFFFGSDDDDTKREFASGGTSPGGPILVGEKGPEIITPPRGTKITPNSGISGMMSNIGSNIGNVLGMGGGGGKAQDVNLHITLELEGRELSKYIKKVTLPMMNPVSGES